MPPATQQTTPQGADNKPKPRLVRLHSSKSAADLMPAVREEIADFVMIQPNHEAVTKKFGSNVLQVVFSVLHSLLWRQRRLEQRLDARDGYGAKVVRMPSRSVREFMDGAA